MSPSRLRRSSWAPLVLLAIALALFLLLRYYAGPERQPEGTAKVVSVADGDSLTVLQGHRNVRVRLVGIDCPERNQPFGTQARQLTSRLAGGQTVGLNITGKDRYKRTLAFVTLPNGKLLQHELLKAGLAWHYKDFNTDADLAKLEDEARKARTGLWSDPHPVPPWEWRKRAAP